MSAFLELNALGRWEMGDGCSAVVSLSPRYLKHGKRWFFAKVMLLVVSSLGLRGRPIAGVALASLFSRSVHVSTWCTAG